MAPLGFQSKCKTADSRCVVVNSDTNSLIVLCSFPQGYPGLLRELSWLSSTPADALALGVVNIAEIIQRSGLPNLQHSTHSRFSQKETKVTSAVIIYLKYSDTRPACLHAGWQTILDVG